MAPASILVITFILIKDGAVFKNMGGFECMSLLNMTVTVDVLNTKVALQAIWGVNLTVAEAMRSLIGVAIVETSVALVITIVNSIAIIAV